MNERIGKLADEADKLIQNQYLVRQQSEWCEKFAELIIKECADIATIHQQNHAHDSIGRYVLDHFGIEEREQ